MTSSVANKKYAHIGSRISSGPTQNKVKYLTNQQVLRRRDEVFLRISKDELAELFEEYEKHDDDEHVESNACLGDDENGPRVCTYNEESEASYERPYLALDVRNESDFKDCHILQARSMPQRFLMQDKMTAELYMFKNAEGKLIVLYDDGLERDRLAAAAAHQLVHRGFENVFVLSRGLASFAEIFPHYVEGDLKAVDRLVAERKRLDAKNPNFSAQKKRGADSTSNRLMRAASVNSKGRRNTWGPDNVRNDNDDDAKSISTRVSELSVADTVISRCTSRKSRF